MNNDKLDYKPVKTYPRPLSPHLHIYRFTLTMILSVAHRISGMVLYGGSLFLVWYLIALADSPLAFELWHNVFISILGAIILLGYSFALIHHMVGGVRHLFEDFGCFFEPTQREILAHVHVYSSIGLTLLFWLMLLIFS